ncbi:FYVE zinc finger-domain-containing protein [Gongronella butleri]|nr:FYVE zinc finger-domain-containing protein [Gongronella butleri]
MGHTPLMNAASKGFISIVEYLLDEAHANPLIKNNNGEAAYDASAASGEAYVCELLEKGGKKWWHTQRSQGGASVYDVVQYHVSVVVILHENQRATSLLGLSRPQFGPGALTKQDVRGPWSLHPSGTPSRKDTVTLPRATDEHSANWCWMTEWDMDLRDPRVDPTSGWQYARSFDVPDDQWTPVAPTSGAGWVRRRRWVRVMNRQASFNGTMAVPQTDYLARADDLLATLDTFVADDNDDQTRIRALTNELRVYEESMQLLRAGVKDDLNPYRKERANQQIQVHAVRIEALNAEIGRLAPQLATPISSVPYNAELARELGFSSSPQGGSGSGGGGGAMSRSHSTSAHDTHGDNDTDDDDDNDHHHAASSKRNRYPTDGGNAQDLDSNPWSVGDRSSLLGKQQRPFTLDDDQSSASSLLQHIHFDTNPHAATTRVHSHSNSNRDAHNGVWESDADVKECRRCNKRFGLLNRRHHCRRCGLIVCDKCSSSRAILAATEIVQNPVGKIASHVLEAQYQRICDKCYADLGISS